MAIIQTQHGLTSKDRFEARKAFFKPTNQQAALLLWCKEHAPAQYSGMWGESANSLMLKNRGRVVDFKFFKSHGMSNRKSGYYLVLV